MNVVTIRVTHERYTFNYLIQPELKLRTELATFHIGEKVIICSAEFVSFKGILPGFPTYVAVLRLNLRCEKCVTLIRWIGPYSKESFMEGRLNECVEGGAYAHVVKLRFFRGLDVG
jgi:hypothetical protein